MAKHGLLFVLFSSLSLPVYPYTAYTDSDKRPPLVSVTTDVSEILGRDPKKADYVVETDCIQARRIESMEVIDQKHIIVEMKAENYFLIQFKNNCQDLRKNMPVWYERRNARLCRFDIIKGVRDMGFYGYEPGMSCFIPGFQSVSKEQVVLIRDSIKKARAESRKNRWRLFPRKKQSDASAL